MFQEIEVTAQEQHIYLQKVFNSLPENLPGKMAATMEQNEVKSSPKERKEEKSKENSPQNANPTVSCNQTKRSSKGSNKSGVTIQYLTKKELENVPSYAKGRVTLEKVNAAINVLNDVVTKKYALLSTPLHQLTEQQVGRIREHKKLDCEETHNQLFFTENDLKGSKIGSDATSKAILQVLKYSGRLKSVGKLFVLLN